jgi:hypothetical protein
VLSSLPSTLKLKTIKLIHCTDAEDLGPLLTASSSSPEQILLKHRITPIAIFLAHSHISSALRPYLGTLRPVFVTAAWFLMPLTVYLYQENIVKAVAKRLFLEPLNDRGQQGLPSSSWTRRFRRRIDAAIVSSWSVILVGPIIDGLFFLTLKMSEGENFVIYSKFNLISAVTNVSYWYCYIGNWGNKSSGRSLTWLFWTSQALLCAAAAYNLVFFGLTAYLFEQCIVIFVNIFGIPWVSNYLLRTLRGTQ